VQIIHANFLAGKTKRSRISEKNKTNENGAVIIENNRNRTIKL